MFLYILYALLELCHLLLYALYYMWNLPRTILHEVLTTEYDQHIDAAVVEHPCPVLQHPFACALVYEIVLEIKDIRVVWRYTDVHVDHFVAVAGGDGWISLELELCVKLLLT